MFRSPGSRETRSLFRRLSVPATPHDALAFNGIQFNGGMEIDQTNAGAAISASGYLVDGVKIAVVGTSAFSAQQVADAPPGYSASIKTSITTAEAVLGATDRHFARVDIEGYRAGRLGFGTPAASPFALCFWFKSNIACLLSLMLLNGTAANRSLTLPLSYPVANLWKYFSMIVPPDFAGTWTRDNSASLTLEFVFAAGSSFQTSALRQWLPASYGSFAGATNGVATVGNTFQMTGLLLIPGNVAPTAAEAPRLSRSIDQELAIAHRYLTKVPTLEFEAWAGDTNQVFYTKTLPVQMRTAPTSTFATSSSYNLAASYPQISPTTISDFTIKLVAQTPPGTVQWVGSVTLNAQL
jgi:hypothetical protein